MCQIIILTSSISCLHVCWHLTLVPGWKTCCPFHPSCRNCWFLPGESENFWHCTITIITEIPSSVLQISLNISKSVWILWILWWCLLHFCHFPGPAPTAPSPSWIQELHHPLHLAALPCAGRKLHRCSSSWGDPGYRLRPRMLQDAPGISSSRRCSTINVRVFFFRRKMRSLQFSLS